MRSSLVAATFAAVAFACHTVPAPKPAPGPDPAASTPAPESGPTTPAPATPAPAAPRPGGGASMSASSPVPPIAAVRRVIDTYHGIEVLDRYQWLEAETDEVKAWTEAEDRWSRSILDKLPGLASLRGEIRAYLAAPIVRYGAFAPAGGKIFAMRKRPEAQQAELVVMTSPEAAADATLVLDPTASGDAHRAIDWFRPSPDGTKLAISISEGGSEAGTLHIIGLDGADLEPPIPGVYKGTGGGDAAWAPGGKVLYYTRYPAKGEKPDGELDFWLQVYSHTLGTPAEKDRLELGGKDLPKIAEIMLESDARGRVLASVQNGDGGVFRHYLRAPRGGWKRLTDWSDGVTSMSLGNGSDLFAVSIAGSPRGKILRWPATATKVGAAKVIVPEGDGAIVTDFFGKEGLVVTEERLYVTVQQGGPSELRAYTLAGKPVPLPALPPVASVGLSSQPLGADVLVGAQTYVEPWMWYRLTPAGALTPLPAISPRPPGSLAGFEVRRELATSRDGTKVPVNIVWRTGAPQDGRTPCLVTGYGGYSISSEPHYMGNLEPLLSRGVCFVEVNLRGGGEFGEAWHQAGMLTRKQNVFDDMAAAIEYVQAQHYTRPDRTVLMGGSNGGLLMGAMIVQHPDLFRAAVSKAGIYDMLRVELTPNGQFNVTEFGSVKDKAQFDALYAYSPYHHVQKGTRYPAVLFTTGANDPRVAPWQSRKMVAALQEAQEGSQPILLRTSSTSGHGAGTAMDERIDEMAHAQAFLLWQAGVAVK